MGFQLPDRSILPQHTLVIGSDKSARGSGQRWAHIYPANGQVTCELALAGGSDLEHAVAVARQAFPA